MILMGTGAIIGIIVGIVVLVVVMWYISTMNNLRRLEVKIEESASGIDVALTKRFDLLTKMLDTTKGYAKHEAETLENVIKWRNGIPANATMEEKSEFASSLSKVASGLNVVVENYPELKANENFLKLQDDLSETEDKVAYARQFYNDAAAIYNNKREMFPSNIIAGIFGFKAEAFFDAVAEANVAPKVQF